MKHFLPQQWLSKENLLLLMAAAVPLSFTIWQSLLNNFAVEHVAFGGDDIGLLQSLREIPGFLAFTAVFLLLMLREQRLALLSLFILGLGTAITGFFPYALGLYLTTVLMSIGFHYFETVQISLSLQWLDKSKAPYELGRQYAVKSAAALLIMAVGWALLEWAGWSYAALYLLGGGLTILVVAVAWLGFPNFQETHPQRKQMILRKRYWLYYALTFMSGARRQIFVVFAVFMMVDKFHFSASDMLLLFLLNQLLSMFVAPRIGALIGRWGERRALTFEYLGLIIVFIGYAWVDSPLIAVLLYIADHLFFAMVIAIKSYFQKIADPADIAATAGVGFTINHIAAVFIPVLFGLLWLVSPAAVFLCGAGMAFISLIFARFVPSQPEPGQETIWRSTAVVTETV